MRILVDSFKMALSSLLAKKARSSLSILGIVIGILTVASLLSIALGVRAEITKSITDLGSNLVFVTPGKVAGQGGSFSSQLGASTLTEKDFESIRSLPEQKLTTIAMLVSGTVKSDFSSASDLLIYGSSPGLDEITNLKLSEGRFNDADDDNQKARIAILKPVLYKSFYDEYRIIRVFLQACNGAWCRNLYTNQSDILETAHGVSPFFCRARFWRKWTPPR